MDEDDETQLPSPFRSHQPTSQGSSAGGNLRRGFGFFYLNSSVDDFPDLGSYQQLLLDKQTVHGPPSAGPGCGRAVSQGGGGLTRSVSIGSAHRRPFVAPAAASVGGGVRGRGRPLFQGTGRGVGLARGASSTAIRGVAGRGFSISASRQRASSSAMPSEDADDSEGFEDGDDNGAAGEERPDVRKFKSGNPEYLDMLIELFQGVAVDG
ncbi:hypothetical protein ZWY2020_038674 [Hordeum vulgare]|nr:hypothetical protein ZWY2020_038674 [Hordeum vulgare]